MRLLAHHPLRTWQMYRVLKSSFIPSSQKTSLQRPYDAWSASRALPGGQVLLPGGHRSFSLANIRLATLILWTCALDFFAHIWSLHRVRSSLMVSLTILRSIFPAFRGYSQALIIDQLQQLITSGDFTWARLLDFILTDVAREIARRIIEGVLESFAASNETTVMDSAKFYVEYAQLSHRVRLDIPTLQDPVVRDLLHESELFTRSFSGGGFGLLSPLDCIHVISLATEIFSHVLLILSLTGGTAQYGILFISVFSATLPLLVSWIRCPELHPEDLYTPRETRAAERQEKMRNLAYDESHRPELELFGLGGWILKTWASARKTVLDYERTRQRREFSIFSRLDFSNLVFALQNVPLVLVLQSSSASLGSLTLYRSSIQSVILATKSLVATSQMVFQGIFLMSAFCAAKEVRPKLQPPDDEVVRYQPSPNGASIRARGISYTYPGCSEPALKNVSFELNPGETLAVVGHNGSGKSTLAQVLLRIVDCEGDLAVNGVSVRRYESRDYHQHLSAIFQNFSKFNSTVKENVGFGRVEKMNSKAAIGSAVKLAEAEELVKSLPRGLGTILETPGFMGCSQHGLSGGEWQRLALARAFMRAHEAQVDLLVLDEPTSSLDAHAQNEIFKTVDRIARCPRSGARTKSVVFITHRLSTARKADKVAMMEGGSLTEFGTHAQLMELNGAYASLYRASL
ncbi:ABC transporter domain-containing protein [Mycena kentingensis (nom. inval.)]|nr:ABC transporter domain-containing protein [Mycena kentingensis (nom. inval.)]